METVPGRWRARGSSGAARFWSIGGAAILAGLVFAGPPGPARAEEAALTIEEALAMAARQNPELLAARARAEAQAYQAEAVWRSRLPRFAVSSNWTRTDNPAYVFTYKLNSGEFAPPDFAIDRLNSPGSISHLTSAAGIEAPLDVFGKIGDQARVQDAAGRAALALAGEAGLEVRLRMIEVYRRAALAQRAVEVTERALEGARAREADAEARVAEGAALQADLLRARARRREREADLADRRGDAAVIAAGLARLLGAAPGTTFVPVDTPGAPLPIAGDEASWIARGLERRPALAASRERLEAARRAGRLEHRGLLPDFLAYGQLQDDRNAVSGGAQSYAIGVTVHWNVLDPARGRRTAVAEAELRAAEQDARAVADQVRLDVVTAYVGAQTARERWAAAAGGAVEGREALRVVQERHGAGRATLTDVLETEAASFSAQLQEIRAAAEAAIADAALERAAAAGPGSGQLEVETKRGTK